MFCFCRIDIFIFKCQLNINKGVIMLEFLIQYESYIIFFVVVFGAYIAIAISEIIWLFRVNVLNHRREL